MFKDVCGNLTWDRPRWTDAVSEMYIILPSGAMTKTNPSRVYRKCKTSCCLIEMYNWLLQTYACVFINFIYIVVDESPGQACCWVNINNNKWFCNHPCHEHPMDWTECTIHHNDTKTTKICLIWEQDVWLSWCWLPKRQLDAFWKHISTKWICFVDDINCLQFYLSIVAL